MTKLRRSRIHQHRRDGRQTILELGVAPDTVLRQELERPGADTRHGVNLVAKPSRSVATTIIHLQDTLRDREPSQYYYPDRDLHLTVVELCYGRDAEETARIADATKAMLPTILDCISPATLDTPSLTFDRNGCALSFLPRNERLQSMRRQLIEGLSQCEGIGGILLEPRYPPESAHITFMRYLEPLRSERCEWTDLLLSIEITQESWDLAELYLTWGPNWYGRRTSIRESGPYACGRPGRGPASR